MLKSLESLGDNLRRGIDDFSRNPVKYSLGAAKDVARDYSDLGVSVFGGFVASDFGMDRDIFGNYDFLGGLTIIFGGMAIGSWIEILRRDLDIASGNTRIARDLFAGLSSYFLCNGTHPSVEIGAGLTAISVYLDRQFHKTKE